VNAAAQQPLSAAIGDGRENRQAGAAADLLGGVDQSRGKAGLMRLGPVTAPMVTETNENRSRRRRTATVQHIGTERPTGGAGLARTTPDRPRSAADLDQDRLKADACHELRADPAEMIMPRRAGGRRAQSWIAENCRTSCR